MIPQPNKEKQRASITLNPHTSHSFTDTNTFNFDNLDFNPQSSFLTHQQTTPTFPFPHNSPSNSHSKQPHANTTNLGTLNIHGTIHAKIHDIINIFKLKSLSLLCITETGKFSHHNIPIENQKITKEIISLTHNTKDNTPQVRLTLISDANGCHSESGVSVLISQHFYNHLQKISCFHGRLICIDFGFKGRKPTRIISIYFPTKSQNNKKISHETTREVTELLDEATKKNYEIIILGDFNRDINKYLLRTPLSSRTPHILNIIDKFHLTDIIGKFFSSPKPTWFSSTASSRIDLILSIEHFRINILCKFF